MNGGLPNYPHKAGQIKSLIYAAALIAVLMVIFTIEGLKAGASL